MASTHEQKHTHTHIKTISPADTHTHFLRQEILEVFQTKVIPLRSWLLTAPDGLLLLALSHK